MELSVPISAALRPRPHSFLGRAFYLSARNRPDVGNVPAHAGKGFYDGDDHDHQKRQMHQRRDNSPEKYQDAADARDCAKHYVHDGGDNVEEKPSAAKNDRLHRVETHETVTLFQNVKND